MKMDKPVRIGCIVLGIIILVIGFSYVFTGDVELGSIFIVFSLCIFALSPFVEI